MRGCDLHRAKELKGRAILFINYNAADVMKIAVWKGFIKSHLHLLSVYDGFALESCCFEKIMK
jgi:hypothetical protein